MRTITATSVARSPLVNWFRTHWRYVTAATAIVLLILIVGPDELVRTLAGADPSLLALYALGFAISPVVYGLQLHRSFHALAHPIDADRAIRAAISSWSIGLLTPARAGDLSLPIFVRPDVPGGTAAAVVIVDKLFSIALLAIVAVTTVALLGLSVTPVLAGSSILLVIIAAAAIAFHKLVAGRTRKLSFVPLRFRDRAAAVVDAASVVVTSRRCLGITFVGVVARWSFLFCLNLLLFRALGASPSLLVVMAATSVGRVIALLPLSIGGVGFKEPVQILIYDAGAIAPETVIAVSVVGLAIAYLTAAVWPPLVNSGRKVARRPA